jgi:threonine dehydratase
LSEIIGAEVWLKFENLQFTAAYKERGALNKLLQLSEEERGRGVIAASAGNHAQAVAYHAKRLGIPAVIVMPEPTPSVKVNQTEGHGAEVVLHGDMFDDAYAKARELALEKGYVFVHPFDDPQIIAGAGTIGLELLDGAPGLDTIVVPIGGGGIMAGIATAAKAINPRIEMIGVEAALYPSMHHAIRNLTPTFGAPTIAEGIAVKSPGALTKAIIERLVSDILLVEEEPLEQAVQLMAETQKVVAEGAGAAGLAAMLAHRQRFAGRRVGIVVCGGNIDARVLGQVLLRGLVRDGRVVELRIGIVDQPGVLGRLARAIGEAGGNILEIHHQRLFTDLPVKRADIDAVVETRNAAHVTEIMASLSAAGFTVRQLSSRSV